MGPKERSVPNETSTTTDPRSADVARAEEDIERAREQVTMSVLALRDEVSRQVDWRQWIRRRPVPFLGAAIVLGFLLGRRR
jgi:hypothetical protein